MYSALVTRSQLRSALARLVSERVYIQKSTLPCQSETRGWESPFDTYFLGGTSPPPRDLSILSLPFHHRTILQK
jgi:hypothetical protein